MNQLLNERTMIVKPLSSFIKSALNENKNSEPERKAHPKRISCKPKSAIKKTKLSPCKMVGNHWPGEKEKEDISISAYSDNSGSEENCDGDTFSTSCEIEEYQDDTPYCGKETASTSTDGGPSCLIKHSIKAENPTVPASVMEVVIL